MKRKIVALVLLVSVVMTGCGVPDRVQEEVKKVEYGYLSEKNEVKATNQKIKNSLMSGFEKTMEYSVSEKRKEQLKNLYELIYSDEMRVLYKEFNPNITQLNKYQTGTDSISEKSRMCRKIQEEYFYGNKPWNEFPYYECKIMLEIEDVEKLKAVQEKLEGIGYTGLSGVVPKTGSTSEIVSNGVKFIIERDYNYDEEFEELYIYETIDEREEKLPLRMTVVVSKDNICYAERFAPVLNDAVEDGFYVTGIDEGGYVERIVLTASYVDLGNEANKSIAIYMKDGKPIQIEILVDGNVTDSAKTLFVEREQKTVANILTWATGNADAATEFSTIELVPEKKGSVGNWNWYRIDYDAFGDYKNYEIRFVAE